MIALRSLVVDVPLEACLWSSPFLGPFFLLSFRTMEPSLGKNLFPFCSCEEGVWFTSPCFRCSVHRLVSCLAPLAGQLAFLLTSCTSDSMFTACLALLAALATSAASSFLFCAAPLRPLLFCAAPLRLGEQVLGVLPPPTLAANSFR